MKTVFIERQDYISARAFGPARSRLNLTLSRYRDSATGTDNAANRRALAALGAMRRAVPARYPNFGAVMRAVLRCAAAAPDLGAYVAALEAEAGVEAPKAVAS